MGSKPGVDQSMFLSLHSKRSVISPLWIHSGFYIPAHGKNCSVFSPFKHYQGLLRRKKHVAHCCCSAGTPKIIPASAAVSNSIVTPLTSFRVGFLAENTERNLKFDAGLRLLIMIILIPGGSDRMYHICTCF